MNLTQQESPPLAVGWLPPVLFAALAGGMAWGVRGQYGHETGAMIAGLLVSLVLVFLLAPRTDSTAKVRAVAWGAIAMGIGGSMTYGQTLGLTQNSEVIGNWAALRWGLFGCAIKGGIWIGFAGVFLGMGLSRVRYRPREMWILMLALIGAYYLGSSLLNRPFNPATGQVPAIYFSESSHWFPEKQVRPRPESWGGLLFALAVLVVYVRWLRQDRLAFNLALWGVLGGALGFPGGQSLQAYHAWNPEVFQQGVWTTLDRHMNWWNHMETTFGATMGAALGFGLWLNRSLIQPADCEESDTLPVWVEALLLAVHLPLLILVDFAAVGAVDRVYDLGLVMVLIPIGAIAGGRFWPHLQILPLTLLPIAGKTLVELAYRSEAIGVVAGWALYFILPVCAATFLAVRHLMQPTERRDGAAFIRQALLFNVWAYFLLNFAFFRFPWPWADWTSRTPSALIFTVSLVGLTLLAVFGRRTGVRGDA